MNREQRRRAMKAARRGPDLDNGVTESVRAWAGLCDPEREYGPMSLDGDQFTVTYDERDRSDIAVLNAIKQGRTELTAEDWEKADAFLAEHAGNPMTFTLPDDRKE